jgi:hypothetical protein
VLRFVLDEDVVGNLRVVPLHLRGQALSFFRRVLVKARGREWVVLPGTEEDILMVRPLGGTDDEITGIYLPIETVEPAQLALPDPGQLGDYRSCRMLRDAIRLGFRSSAGPFRSFARMAVDPRPYQLVPLMLARDGSGSADDRRRRGSARP